MPATSTPTWARRARSRSSGRWPTWSRATASSPPSPSRRSTSFPGTTRWCSSAIRRRRKNCRASSSGWTERTPSEQLVDRVSRVVFQLAPAATPAPLLQIDLRGARHVPLEDRVQALRGLLVQDPERDLVVGLERAVVEVGGADSTVDAVDGHHRSEEHTSEL